MANFSRLIPLLKLKAYPFEFEVDKDLKLASINGIKLANNTDEVYQITKNGKYNVEVSGSDTILTLSTCSGNTGNKRTVVHAKKID